MEHSVRKYLERQSTQKLEIALQGLRQEGRSKEAQVHIGIIEEILRKRMMAEQVEMKE